jgi:hypothetical protein
MLPIILPIRSAAWAIRLRVCIQTGGALPWRRSAPRGQHDRVKRVPQVVGEHPDEPLAQHRFLAQRSLDLFELRDIGDDNSHRTRGSRRIEQRDDARKEVPRLTVSFGGNLSDDDLVEDRLSCLEHAVQQGRQLTVHRAGHDLLERPGHDLVRRQPDEPRKDVVDVQNAERAVEGGHADTRRCEERVELGNRLVTRPHRMLRLAIEPRVVERDRGASA